MKRYIAFLSLVFVVAAAAGCVFDSDNDTGNDVAKGTVSGTVKLTVSGDPVIGMKVYLINANAPVDSTSAESIFNRVAFVDSAVTDANGRYSITNIAPGNYGVAPVNEDTTSVYTFTQAAASDSCLFSMSGNSLTVNFIAEKTDYPGIIYEDSDVIRDFVQFTQSGAEFFGKVTCVVYRRHWVVFVPFLSEVLRTTDDLGGISTRYTPGSTGVVYTLDNCYFYEITTTNPTKVHKFSIYHPLSTPAGSKFDYTFDFGTDILTENK